MERPEAIYIARLHRARSSIQNKFSAVAMWPTADQYRLLWELAFSVIFIHVYIWDRLSSVVALLSMTTTEKLQSILLLQFYPQPCRIICDVDKTKLTFNYLLWYKNYSEKLNTIRFFQYFWEGTLSVAAPSVVSLLAKDSVLAFMHDYTV